MGKKSKRERRRARRKRLEAAAASPLSSMKRPRIFLDTSGVIYHRHGHSLMQSAVREAIGEGLVEVSNFIRMEYMRGVILNLVELYFLIKESESVSDALIDWSQKVNQERKLKIVLMTMNQWLVDHEDWQDKLKSQRRLGDLIVRLAYDFDDVFRGRAKDQLQCRLGRIRFPRRIFAEDMLLRFYERFKAVQAGIPDCQLCQFKTKHQVHLTRKSIDLCGPVSQQKYVENKGYIAQAQRLVVISGKQFASPKCRMCEQLGDTIIILQAPSKAILVTADRAFEAFGDILKREIRRLPSLAQLKRQIHPEPQQQMSD
jgi:hypothetical protein